MTLLLWLVVFAVSLAVLIVASDFFIASAEKVGAYLGIPSFVVGVIIVGLGTSLPELVSSIFAVTGGASEIVVGNVLGSNITNILLVVGIGAVMTVSFEVGYDLLHLDIPFLLGSLVAITVMTMDGNFTTGEAVICLVLLAIYILQSFSTTDEEGKEEREKLKAITWTSLLLSPIAIFLGAKYTIDAVLKVSEMLKIGTEVIALSVVALGTSLPEVMVTIAAARRGNPDMVIGNVIGSNIFNTFAVMGIPALFGKLKIPTIVNSFSSPMHFGVSLLFIIMIVDRRINRWEGFLLITLYIYFIGSLYKVI
ncbi:MAG: calcium/sodium antiporter [Spirochaetota bacterium]